MGQTGEKGGRRRLRRGLIILAAVAAAAGGYFAVMAGLDRAPLLNAAVVDPGRLIRSGRPEPGDLEAMRERYGLATIFSVRGVEEPDVVAWARAHGVKIVALRMWADSPPRRDQVGLFFDVMRGDTVDLGQYQAVIVELEGAGGRVRFPFPVLIHCDGGADRTGVMVALYRVAFEGWSVDEAEREMIRRFHLPQFHPRLFPYLERIAPQLTPEFGSRSRPGAVPPPVK